MIKISSRITVAAILASLAFSAIADTAAKRQNDKAANPEERVHPNFEFKDESRGQSAYRRLVNSGKSKEFSQYYPKCRKTPSFRAGI